ncbi:hypothetical protein C8R47DRAFT_1208543 [Mycena vitilis]|nr:hypothetical protein C8R47DRAFT_1208543 [Mycena vitilis]
MTRLDDGQSPSNDLDELFATLRLEEEGLAPRPHRRHTRPAPPHGRNTRPAPAGPGNIPVRVDEREGLTGTETRAHHVPNARPPPPRPQTPPPPYSPTLPATRNPVAAGNITSIPPTTPSRPATYSFHSPTLCGQTQDWSEAASATQGIPHASVSGSPRAKRRRKKGAYVVFRGRSIGVCHTWAEVQADTSGVRFALQQGYPTPERALAAFELAEANGWTCASRSWSAVPITASLAPKPWPHQSGLSARGDDDPWYVVYAGVNPGIYGTSLECSLNVLGIRCSHYDSALTFEAAQAQFARAIERGEVRVCRSRESI